MLRMVNRKRKGFTLVEVLVALMVGAIVLTASATLANAMTRAKGAADKMSRNGAYLLQLDTRLSDLMMRANEVVAFDSQGVTLWYDKNADGVKDAGTEYIQITTTSTGDAVAIDAGSGTENYTLCKNVQFYLDSAVASSVRQITIQFSMTEGGVTQTYSVGGTLRGN